MKEVYSVCYLFTPLLLGLATHGICIKFNLLANLCKPIDKGSTYKGKPIFGPNKTYRGIVAVGIGTSIGFILQSAIFHKINIIQSIELIDYSITNAIIFGFCFGSAAMISELPNSFIKRQFNIEPGEAATGFKNILFYIADQIDFLIGTWLALAFVMPVSIERIVISIIYIFVTHQLISSLGFFLGMRKSAR